MADSKAKSFTDQIQLLIESEADFLNKFKQRLVFESSKVANPFKFISGMLSKGVLCDGSNDSEENFGLKEWMVQLATTMACSKGAEAIGGLMEALEESGNLQLVSALQTWVRQDFAIESDGDRSQPKGPPDVQTGAPENLPEKQQKSTANSSFIDGDGIDTITDNNLRNQPKQEKPKILMSQFFEQAPPSNALEKVATFNCPPELFTNGKFELKFNKERMIACFPGGTVKLWNWRENEETTNKFGSKDKDLTAFQYDEEILVLGTSAGAVHLFDAKTLEEKWSDRFMEPVHSLKMANSTLVVVTRIGNEDKIWWVEISRSDMRLLNRRPVMTMSKDTNYGILIDNYSFVYYSNIITIRCSKTGESYPDGRSRGCWMEAPGIINTLNVLDLTGAQSSVIAGCKNGFIAIWHTCGASALQRKPIKSFQGHEVAIVGLTAINGHLLSVCEGGQLLMWSGHDLINQRVTPIPRVLAENLTKVTSLVACERWFASTSSEDSTINIWALPELWLRTG